jgi:hypothetical protein
MKSYMLQPERGIDCARAEVHRIDEHPRRPANPFARHDFSYTFIATVDGKNHEQRMLRIGTSMIMEALAVKRRRDGEGAMVELVRELGELFASAGLPADELRTVEE